MADKALHIRGQSTVTRCRELKRGRSLERLPVNPEQPRVGKLKTYWTYFTISIAIGGYQIFENIVISRHTKRETKHEYTFSLDIRYTQRFSDHHHISVSKLGPLTSRRKQCGL